MKPYSVLAAILSISVLLIGSAANAQKGSASPLPPEARCASLGVWGEHHTTNERVRSDMSKMSLFYLGKLAARQPERHWSDFIIVDAQRNGASPDENGKAIKICLHDMQPYLSEQAAVPKVKT